MNEEKNKQKAEKEEKKAEETMEEKNEEKTEKKEEKAEETEKDKEESEKPKEKTEKDKEEKKAKKIKEPEIKKKEKASAYGKDLPISTKHSVAVCKFIRGKDIEKASSELQKIAEKKTALPMKGELPHRKKMERGRYPVNACKIFIKLLKNLSANCSVGKLEEPYISIAKADIASRPHKRFGSRRFKRTNVYLEGSERKKKQEGKIKDK